MTKTLWKGKKVFLRHPKTEDFAEFIALNKSSRRFHKGLVKTSVDKQGFDDYLARNEKEENECFLICRNTDGAIVGVINLSQIFRGVFQNAYLGYCLGGKFTGFGFMAEAVELILRFAFKELKLHRVEANVQPRNAASIGVLQKTGFTKEGFSPKYLKIGGRWRDHERWAIIAEDWRGKK